MFQKIAETTTASDILIHTLSNGTLIAGFEVDLFDEEVFGLQASEQMLQSLLRSLPDGRLLRVYLKSEYSNEVAGDHSRSKAIQHLGYVKNQAFIFLEKPVSANPINLFSKKKAASGPLTDFNMLRDNGVKVRPLSAVEVADLLVKIGGEIHHNFQTIDTGSSVVSVLRLTKQSEFGMDLSTLSHIKDTLPLPYTICCSIEAVPQATSETILRRRSKQNSVGTDIKENRKFEEAQNDLEEVSLNGSRLFRFEWLVAVERKSEADLRIDREEIKRRLEPLGEIYIESVGALSSLKSFYPGEPPHFSLLEKDSVLVTYIPMISRGDPKPSYKMGGGSMTLHRRDETLTNVNIFDPTYESFSWCIFGRPGTGKSVLTNAITRALVHDPGIKVIKIDVGGSHSRETEMLGGIEKTLSLNEPTGINPFDVLSVLGATKEAIQILASFLEVLILEEGEVKLTKTMKSDLERALHAFSETLTGFPTLETFALFSKEIFPRRELLNRWVGSGVYSNAFKVPGTSEARQKSDWSRLVYYNFSKISQALDPDFAQGGLAAVMAQFNLEMLKGGPQKQKIVFIADETPFFIKKCFSFFNLSIANVRKEGHGFITVAQKSAHVVVGGDTGILDNSPNKIFFSLDGDDESFLARTQTSKDTVERIKNLKRVQGEFSECLFKDKHGERVLRIKLSPEEYWSYTSKDEDRKKYAEIKAACPSLRTEEIIRCLSL